MNTDISIALAICVLLLVFGVLAAVVLSGWLLVRFSRETQRIIHVCDERVKAVYAVSEKSFSRIMAWAYPNAHQRYREGSGSIEGSQHRARGFPQDEPGPAGSSNLPPGTSRSEPDPQQMALAHGEPFDSQGMIPFGANGSASVPGVATQLDFETRQPPRT